MKKLSLTLIFTISVFFLLGQNKIIVSGLVKDKTTGEPLIGANILETNSSIGTSSDVHGFYSIELETKDNIELKVSFVGYIPFQKEIVLANKIRYDILLTPGIELSAVEVNANRLTDNKLELGAVDLPSKLITKLPILGEPDVLKAMQLLPGVQGGSDGRSGLYVRGGSPDQNLFMLDGTPLYYVNHLGGFVSVFPPEILKNIKLYKGGFPSRFGGRLSSIIDLRLKEGNKKELHGSYGIGLISGDFTLEGPIKNEKTSFIVSLRRVWIDLLLRPATKIGLKHASMGYNFYDFYGKISHEADKKNRLYFSLYGGDDRLGFFYNNRDDKIKNNTKYIWGNILATARWNHIHSAKAYSDITLFYTRYRYKYNLRYSSNNSKGYNLYSTGVHDVGLKADYNWHATRNYKIRYGGGLSFNWFNPGQIHSKTIDNQSYPETAIGSLNKSTGINTYAYIENEFIAKPWISMNIGTRIVNNYIEGKNYFSLEPRFLSNIRLKNIGSLKIGYSKMVQPVHMLTYSGSVFPTDIWLPSSPEIPPGSSIQYSVGYAKSFNKSGVEISLEAYHKNMENLIEVKGGVPLVNTQSWENNVEKDGIGTSKGLELLIQKKLGTTTGWVSYTLSKSDRQFENINNGKTYNFKYDRRHDFSIVLSHKLSKKVDISATWIYGSGYPITLHNGKYQAIEPDQWNIDPQESSPFVVTGEAYLYPGKNWLRMRDYHRLDIGINLKKEKKNKKGKNIVRTWSLGVYNAYNRQNAVYYYYDHKDQNTNNPIVLYQQSGFPFIPTAKYSVKF